MFGKASSDNTIRMLGNSSEQVTDVVNFRTKGINATGGEVLAAVDREFCSEQGGRLIIFRSHMDSLELNTAN